MWLNNAINLWVVFVGVLTAVYFYIRRQFSFWAERNVPFIEPHFLYGNFGDFVRGKATISQLSQNVYNRFKGERFVGVWEMHVPRLFVTDPKLVQDILIKDFAAWTDRGITVNLDVDQLSEHLVNLNGKKWKSVRSKLTPTFTSAKLKQMHYLLVECSKDLEKYLDAISASGEPVEVREVTAKFTTDVIGSCAFGIQMNSLNDEDATFRKMGKKLFTDTFKRKLVRMIQSGFPWLFHLLKLTTTPSDVSDFFINIMKETFDYREKNDIQRHDFIDLLRSLKNTGEPLGEDEVEFDDKLLAAQAFVFFIGGFETSSTTVSYTFHELAANEDIQDRLRKEVHKTKAENNGEITWDSLKSMKYLDMVVQETLRKYPFTPILERTSVKPYRIPGTNVDLPTGLKCIIPVYGFHHDPEYYSNPDKFDPERFSEENTTQRPPCTFLAFGKGPRVCIGLRFAEQQMKMALVKTVDTFKLSLCEKSQNPLRFRTNTRFHFSDIGIWLKISKINPEQTTSVKEQTIYT